MLAAEPTVTDWMQGWGSIAGVVMAALAALFTGLLLRHEARVRREEKADSEAAQARLIVGPAMPGSPEEDGGLPSKPGQPSTPVFGVQNYSGAPIFAVQVTVEIDRASRRTRDEYHASFMRPAVEAGAFAGERYPKLASAASLDVFKVTVSFFDANGAAWERTNLDEPVRVRSGGSVAAWSRWHKDWTPPK